MSAVSAAVGRDGSIVDEVRSMVRAGRHRGTDGEAIWHADGVAVGLNLHRSLPTDPLQAAIYASPDGRFLAALDGRIDNLSDLRETAHACPADAPDLAHVVEHFRCHGSRGFGGLVGDFAVVIWDTYERSLTAAVDPMAGRALYACAHSHGWAIASELRQLLANRFVPKTLDVEFVAEVLTGDPRTLGATPYRSIQRLPPGTALTLRDDGRHSSSTTFWKLEPSYDRRPYDELRDDLRHRLTEAVRCRLRVAGSAAFELSGGLDSSSIVGIASVIGRPVGGSLLAFTNAYSAGDADERVFAEAAARHSAAELCVIDDDERSVFATGDDAAFSLDVPAPPDAGDSTRLARAAVARGARVILTGQGGDQVLGGMPCAALDHLAGGHPLRAMSVAWANGHGHAPMRAARGVYWSMAEPLRTWLRPRSGRALSEADLPWLTPELLRQSRVVERLAEADRSSSRLPRPWDSARIEAISSGAVVQQWDTLTRIYGAVPLDARHPYMDRRLVELAAALPPKFTYRGDDWRSMQRAVIKGWVPEQIRQRTDKAEFSHLAGRYLARLGGRHFFERCEPVRRGWVEGPEIVRRYDAFAAESHRPPHGPSLLATAAVHHLLAALDA